MRPPKVSTTSRRDIDLRTNGGVADPFDYNEPNPTLTNAIDSSLWELYTHRQHYHSAVSTLVRIFEEAFTKPNYALEDFLDHTYSTVSSSVAFLRPSSYSRAVTADVRDGVEAEDQEGACDCDRRSAAGLVPGAAPGG